MKEKNKNDFFNKLAIQVGITDVDSVKKMYYALVRTITQGLREEGNVVLPGLGRFKVFEQKARRIGMVGTKQPTVIPSTKRIGFYVDRNLREYFKNLWEIKRQ